MDINRREFLATVALILKGYRILGRRVRTRVGEIDLIARSPGGILCFVEVKSRNASAAAPRHAPFASRTDHPQPQSVCGGSSSSLSLAVSIAIR